MPIGPPPKKTSKVPLALLITLASCGALFVLFVIIVAIITPTDKNKNSIAGPPSTLKPFEATTAAPTTAASTTTAPARSPTPEDFQIEVIELSRSCFGSAGCNITYKIKPTFTGVLPGGSKSWTVIYEIRGGDDTKVANFTMRGDGEASFRSQDDISTPPAPTLTAVVTRVV